MNVYEITAATLERDLNESVPDLFVVMAKHQVMGMDASQIAEVLNCETTDILEAEQDPLYKRVKGFIGEVYASQSANQTTGWDAIESIAMEGLLKRLPFEKDSEFLLRVAAVANKAQRRHTPQNNNVLDANQAAGRKTIVLTQRLISKMSGRGEQITEERSLSISDGSMTNPNFEEINDMLSVRAAPVLSRELEIHTRTADPSHDELLDDLMNRANRK